MPHVDLAALSGTELRALLDSTRQHGQASASYEILQEMAARRERGGKRSATPRMVAMNLGDPLEPQDEFVEEVRLVRDEPEPEPEVVPEPVPEATAPVAEEPPLSLVRPTAHDPEPWTGLSAEAPLHMPKARAADPPPPRTPRKGSSWSALAFTVGVALGVGIGWWLSGIAHDSRAPVLAGAAAPPAAVKAPVAAPVAAPAPEASIVTPPPPPPAPAATDQVESPPPASDATSAAPDATPAVAPPEPVERAAKPAVAVKGACAAQPTPADQTICGDPRLQRLQQELRDAYAEALDAHEDRALLRERQLAWKDGRDGVSDPDRLARIYEDRIRRLKAATAEALREK